MAKSSSFFGLRRGSTKSLTFSVVDGKQITKDRVSEVKNPRSSTQMAQRSLMSATTKGYSLMKSICDHSFEGVPYGRKSMSRFYSKNLDYMKANAPKVNIPNWKNNAFVNPFFISEGSLPSVEMAFNKVTNTIDFNVFNDQEESTQQASKIFASLGLKIGDYMTFVLLSTQQGIDAEDYSSYFYWIRLHITESVYNAKWDLAQKKSLIELFKNIDPSSVEYSSVTADANFDVTIENEIISIDALNSNAISAASVILSSLSDGVWKRSTQRLIMMADPIEWNYNTMLERYPQTEAMILNGGTK